MRYSSVFPVMDTVDVYALIKKAKACRSFHVCLDIDVDEELTDAIPDQPNVCITPHIAGGGNKRN